MVIGGMGLQKLLNCIVEGTGFGKYMKVERAFNIFLRILQNSFE